MTNLTRNSLSNDEVIEIGVNILSFLAQDEERITRFLDLTGLDPSDLRALMASGDLNKALIEYLLQDEALLVGFCNEYSIKPDVLVRYSQLFEADNSYI